ncbi:MAG: DUF5317 domain-containing protein [Candidatus Dormibacteraeota bacterium]|nr:DUF5317 domain-containing protein [Candidatus Dormibacteraeota bacterium]
MLLLAAVFVGIALGLVTGGKLGNLANLRFRWPFFVVAVLLIREMLLLTPLSRVAGAQILYAVSLAGLVAWTVWHVDRLPGVWLVSVGAALNLIVVAANAGRMPVAPELAARGSGILVDRGIVGQYVLMGSGTRLNWLADWLALPGPLGTWLPDAYSPGDIVVALGILVVAFLGTRRRVPKVSVAGETTNRIVSDPP